MTLVNIHEAKTQFSKLINEALKGKEIIIARGGKPIIKLLPLGDQISSRHGGQFKGLITINEDFDAPLPKQYLKYFLDEKDEGIAE